MLSDVYLQQYFVDMLKTHNQNWVQNYFKNLQNKHDKNHIFVYNLNDLINKLIRLKIVIKKNMGKEMQFKKAMNSEKESSQNLNTLTTQNSKELNISQNINPSTSQNTQNS